MNRIHEKYSLKCLIPPQSLATAVTSAFFPPKGKEVLLMAEVATPGLGANKSFLMEVLRAKDAGGTDSETISAALNQVTAGAGGLTRARLITSLPIGVMTEERPYLAVRVSAPDSTPLVSVHAIQGGRYIGAELNLEAGVSIKVV